MSVGSDKNSIASHGRWARSWGVAWVVETCVIVTAGDDLEDVAMEVKGVSRVVVSIQHIISAICRRHGEQVMRMEKGC
jgi:hypothetical protein